MKSDGNSEDKMKNEIKISENKEQISLENVKIIETNTEIEKKDESLQKLNTNNNKFESFGKNEVRIAVIGNVDSGKSTMVGVLTRCILDDGRGSARQLVFNFTHEKENGRTSSITHEIMGFKDGKQVEVKHNQQKNTGWSQIIKESDKIVSIIDLCGHEKYLKTTIFGLTGLVPDYALIVVGANMGVQRMTKEHLGIALALKIPLFIVITKIDIAPKEILKQTLDYLVKILKGSGTQKLPIIIRKDDDIAVYSENILSEKVCPIFTCSSLTGEGIDQIRTFISLLNPRSSSTRNINQKNDFIEFLIDGAYMVKGVGLIVSGTLISGIVETGKELSLGPDNLGKFKQVVVKSIHYKRTPVDQIGPINSCCFMIKSKISKEPVKREDLRKGMVLVEKTNDYKPAYVFEADVIILHHATTIKEKYQSVIHCGVIRQTAQVIAMSKECLRTGDRAKVKFRFLKSPELIKVGSTILFREGRTRGIGEITKIIYT